MGPVDVGNVQSDAIRAYRSRRHSTFGTFRSIDTLDSTTIGSSPASSFNFPSPVLTSTSTFNGKGRARAASLASINQLVGYAVDEESSEDEDGTNASQDQVSLFHPIPLNEQRYTPNDTPILSRNASNTSLLLPADALRPHTTPNVHEARSSTPSFFWQRPTGSRTPSVLSMQRFSGANSQSDLPNLDNSSRPSLRRAMMSRRRATLGDIHVMHHDEDPQPVERPKPRRLSTLFPKIARKASETVNLDTSHDFSSDVVRPRFLKKRQDSVPAIWYNQGSASPSLMSRCSSGHRPVGGSLFDLVLPKELQLRIFETLLRDVAKEYPLVPVHWPAKHERWCGEARAYRELFRLMQVSRNWMHLVMDGQLWTRFDINIFGPNSIGTPSLLRMASIAGPFLRHLNLRGLQSLNSNDLLTITESCSVYVHTYRQTRLRSVDLSGCKNVGGKALRAILAASPLLQSVCLRGLSSVDSTHLATLFGTALCLRELDVGRCKRLCANALIPPDSSTASTTLRSLKACRVQKMTDDVFHTICTTYKNLVALDVAETPLLSDRAFAKVCSDANTNGYTLSWQCLNLSNCLLLSDSVFDHLSGLLPDLRILEAANLDSNARDAGLVKLLQSTPSIERLDLEGASYVTDRVIAALTPPLHRSEGWTGQYLEHLVISYAVQVTDAALLRLIKQCPNLRVLEADNTRITDSVVKHFVQTMRARQHSGAELCIVDCSGLSRQTTGESLQGTRTRRGVAGWEWSQQQYLSELPPVGRLPRSNLFNQPHDEFDASQVVVHRFVPAYLFDLYRVPMFAYVFQLQLLGFA